MSRLFIFFVQSFMIFLVLVFAILLVFRWVPLPTSAFIYKQNMLARESPKIYEKAAYEWVGLDEISPNMSLAVIAAEDQRFPDHWGIDTIELSKSVVEKK